MNFVKNTFLLFSALIITSQSLYATTRKVLFIGNSYTYVNSVPAMLQSFATAKGDTLVYDMSAVGGYTLQQHSTDATTISKIFSQQWDIVVLQEQSQLPAFPPAQVDTEVYPYAHKLDSMIHANDTCTQTMFMMTWGHQNGDPMNCASYPVICTYAGMQGRLRESYMQMTMDNNAIVAPVGAAWKVVIDSFPSINLFQADSSHAAMTGSYLETAVLYVSIFHRQARGCSYTAGLATTDVQTLQRIADKVTLDSLSQWQQYGHYPYSAFDHLTSGHTVTYTNHSTHASNYTWSFGDGGSDAATNPVHYYTANGTYTVSLTVHTNCFTETRTDTVHIGTLGISSGMEQKYPVAVRYSGNGDVTFAIPDGIYDMLEVYDISGRKVTAYELNGSNINAHFQPGFYVFKAWSYDGKASYFGKLTP